MLQVDKVATRSEQEAPEPGGEQFNRVLLAMPNHVSLCIEVNNVRGLIRALAIMISSNSAIFQSLNPFGRAEDSIIQGNVEVGNLSIIDDVALEGLLEVILVVLDMILQAINLSLEAFDFSGCLCLASGNNGEETFGDCTEDVQVELGMGSKGHCNSNGRHRWFQALDQPDQERCKGFGGQDI